MLHVDVFAQHLMCWHHSFWPPRVPFTKLFQGDDGQEDDESEEKGETYSVQDAWWSSVYAMISMLELVWNCMHEIVGEIGEIIIAKFLALMTTIHDTSRTHVPNLSKFDLLGSVVGRILHDFTTVCSTSLNWQLYSLRIETYSSNRVTTPHGNSVRPTFWTYNGNTWDD